MPYGPFLKMDLRSVTFSLAIFDDCYNNAIDLTHINLKSKYRKCLVDVSCRIINWFSSVLDE